MPRIVTVIEEKFPGAENSFSKAVQKSGRELSNKSQTIRVEKVTERTLSCTVRDNAEYKVDVVIEGKEEQLGTFCTCPDSTRKGRLCKHMYAVLFSFANKLVQIPEAEHRKPAIAKLFATLDKRDKKAKRKLKEWSSAGVLFPSPKGGVTFQLGEIYTKADGTYGSFREMSDSEYELSMGGLLIKDIKNLYRNRVYKDEMRGQILSWFLKERIPLFSAASDGAWRNPKITINGRLTFAHTKKLLFLEEESSGLTLLPFIHGEGEADIPLTGGMEILSREPLFLLWQEQILPIEGVKDVPFVEELLKQTKPNQCAEVDIPAHFQEEFRTTYAPKLAQNGAISKESLETVLISDEPIPELYLSEPREGSLRIQLSFKYGDISLPPGNDNVTKRHGSRLLKIRRSERSEMGALKRLFQADLKLSGSTGDLVPRGKPLEWVVQELPKLKAEEWSIYGEKDLVSLQTVRLTPTVKVSINARSDWFDTSIEIESDGEALPLYDLQRMIQQQETGYRDGKGRWVTITDRWINRFKPLISGAYELEGTSVLKVPYVHWSAVDRLFRELEAEVTPNEVAQQMIDRFRNFTGVKPIPVDTSLKATLRPYQKAGYDWMIALQELGCGGCLADDMGLGKTVMAIALLCREYVTAQKPTLIVCPTSVLFNWQQELTRFAPHLSVGLYYGNNRKLENAQIVLTTYALLRLDIEKLSKQEWHYVILDEAQAIKNPAAQTTKAARVLKATHRLALTGTPIENGLTELWSLFSFINPGLLFSHSLFKEHFVKEIEQNKQHESASFLHRLVDPFLLRRTKELVTPELPPKTETVLVEEMTEVQKKLYAEVRDSYRAELLARMKKKGSDSTKIDVLAALTRLRQICCHPALYDKTLAVEHSAKFDMLDTLLDDIKAEGHKVLIFSQFVGMLTLTEQHLNRNSIKSITLTGATRNRKAVVEKFQKDKSITAFLISLKAGGTGLNLVEADYVIHLDPWWNPAVEAQATDRVHRIGQNNPVFVYKCVMKDSVEEKILTLQERKRDLNEAIIATDESIVKSLSASDIESLFR